MPTLLSKEQRRDLALFFSGALPLALLSIVTQAPSVAEADVLDAVNQGQANAATLTYSPDTEAATNNEVSLITSEQQAGGSYYISGTLNVRSGPGTSYPVVNQYHAGDSVPLSSITQSSVNGYTWKKGPIGWFAITGSVRLVTSGGSAETNQSQITTTSRETTSATTYLVNGGSLTYLIVDSNNNRVGTLPPGSSVRLLGQDTYWYHVSGGYVLKSGGGLSTSTRTASATTSEATNTGGGLLNFARSGVISGDPASAFYDGGYQETGVPYSATVVRGTNVEVQGSNYVVTLSTGGILVVPQQTSRIVRWVNSTQLGPGSMDVLTYETWVQPSYLVGYFAYDASTNTLVISG